MKKLLSIVTALVMAITMFSMPVSAWAEENMVYDNSVIEANIETVKNFVKENSELTDDGSMEFKFLIPLEESDIVFNCYMCLSDKDILSFVFEGSAMNGENGLYDFMRATMEIPPLEQESFRIDTYYNISVSNLGRDSVNAHTNIGRDYEAGSMSAEYVVDSYPELDLHVFDNELKPEKLNELLNQYGDAALGAWYMMLAEIFEMNLDSIGFKGYCGEHNYNEVLTEPTCTEQGYTTYTCKYCGISYNDVYTNPLNHQEVVLPAVAPTCTSTGLTEGSKCARCGEIFTAQKIVAKIAHTPVTATTKATLTADGKIVTKCADCGTVSRSTVIAKPATIKLSTTSYTYDGKAKKPTVTVKDSKGNTISSANYTVKYASGCKNVGKYKVTVTFKGNYSGTKDLYFTINPKSTSVSKVTAASKGFTVKWKKQSTQTTGYEIQYSTDKNFKKGNKTVAVSKNSTTSKKITKLKGKKKYFVRVRTYKTVNGTKYYSAWSKAKTVTTKK